MNSRIHYRSVAENNDYLLVKVIYGLDKIIIDSDIIPNDVYTELQTIYFGLFEFQSKNNRGYYKHEPVALRKDSLVGRFILSHNDLFIDDDTDVTYNKVVGAYNIATFQDNAKMINKIMPLFMKRISGSKDELSQFCSQQVLDFILENGDFDEYLQKLDGKNNNENKEYVVFENGEYSKRTLSKEKVNIKVKSMLNQ